MQRRFETELKQLKARILAMGGYVEQAIEKATQALSDRDTSKFNEVFELEKKVNDAQVAIDDDCMELLARQSPVATDLRLVLAVIKINTDLERMGDQAVNIAHNAEHILQRNALVVQLDIPKMAQMVRAMVRDALDAFMKEDTLLAQGVLESDDAVDEFKNEAFKVLVSYMQKNPDGIEAALDLILIARNLERMADHATNIAEDVIFAFTGEDVRHSGAN